MDCSLPGSFVHEILQARILEWVAILFTRGSSQPREWTHIFCIAGRFFTIWAIVNRFYLLGAGSWDVCMCSVVSNSLDPMNCSLPGSSLHWISLARILEWVAISSSRGSSWPRDQTLISCVSFTVGRFFTVEPPGKPKKLGDASNHWKEKEFHR